MKKEIIVPISVSVCECERVWINVCKECQHHQNGIIWPIINRIESANGNLNVEASVKRCTKKRCKCCVPWWMFVLCCASEFSNIISHSNLERMKMFCAFRLHDYCGAIHNCTVYTMMVCICVCVVPGCLLFLSFFGSVFVSSFLSFRSTSLCVFYSCNSLSSIVLHTTVFQSPSLRCQPSPSPFHDSSGVPLPFSRPFYHYLKWRKQRNESVKQFA